MMFILLFSSFFRLALTMMFILSSSKYSYDMKFPAVSHYNNIIEKGNQEASFTIFIDLLFNTLNTLKEHRCYKSRQITYDIMYISVRESI